MAITGVTNSQLPATKMTLSSNYIDFAGGSTGWEQQYLPDLMEKEAEVFGNRTSNPSFHFSVISLRSSISNM